MNHYKQGALDWRFALRTLFPVYIGCAVCAAAPTRTGRTGEVAEYGAQVCSTNPSVLVDVEPAV